VPRAIHAHLDRDLSGPVGARTGRHPLPQPEAFAERLRAWGVDARTQVVAYDQGNGAMASRLWWLARWVGHDAVAVLDGGLQAWIAAGGPLDRAVSAPRRGTFVLQARADRTIEAPDVERGLADGSLVVVDARAADRFEGRNETIDPVAGHVPGARNHPFAANLGPDGRFLAPAALRALWQSTLGGADPRSVAVMCGSGVTACHDLLALEHAGLPGARLYPGSWSEWIRDAGRGVARGAA
jgi:thiosulfate/3-mercaptopyruvate sulfurtransferase